MEKDFKVVVATADRNDCSVVTWYECKGKYLNPLKSKYGKEFNFGGWEIKYPKNDGIILVDENMNVIEEYIEMHRWLGVSELVKN